MAPDFIAAVLFAVLAVAALVVPGARFLGRARRLRGKVETSETRTVSGSALQLGAQLSWLDHAPVAWVARRVHLELRPVPGRAVVDPRFSEVETVYQERAPRLALTHEAGMTSVLVDADRAIEGAHQAQCIVDDVGELPALARAAILEANPSLNIHAGQRLRLVEEWVGVGESVFARGRVVSAGRRGHWMIEGAEIIALGSIDAYARSLFKTGLVLVTVGAFVGVGGAFLLVAFGGGR